MGNDVEDGKLCAFLAYLLVGIIWYFADDKMKKNDFVKFHVKQGLILLIVAIIAGFVNSLLIWIPILGWLAMSLINLTIFVLWIIGIINVLNGKQKKLPIIGGFSKKLTF